MIGKKKAAFLLSILLFACTPMTEQEAETILQDITNKVEQEEDISGDFSIMEAKDYFVKKKNKTKAALACYYCGLVHSQRKEDNEAIKVLIDAETYTIQTKNYNLLVSIYYQMGKMYQNTVMPEQSVEKLQLAIKTIQKYSVISKEEFDIYNTLALSYRMLEENDSATEYFHRALQNAVQQNDSVNQSLTLRNIGGFNLVDGMIDSARVYLFKSIDVNNDIGQTMYYNLAKLYFAEEKKDSGYHYINNSLILAGKEGDDILCSNLYRFLFNMEKDAGNYQKAIEYQDLYTYYLGHVLRDKQQNDLIISEKRYKYEQAQNQNKQLLIERQYIMLVVLLLLILIISVTFYFTWRQNKQKAHLLEMEKASLEAEQQIQSLQNMAAGFNEKERSLRMELLSHFDILKKVALLKEDEQLNDKTGYKRSPMERINEIFYGAKGFDWDLFFDSMRSSALYKTVFFSINEKLSFQQLDIIDQRVCYLTCMDFSNSEIATLLVCSLRTIEQRKTNLRKKLNIPNKEDLRKHLI